MQENQELSDLLAGLHKSASTVAEELSVAQQEKRSTSPSAESAPPPSTAQEHIAGADSVQQDMAALRAACVTPSDLTPIQKSEWLVQASQSCCR